MKRIEDLAAGFLFDWIRLKLERQLELLEREGDLMARLDDLKAAIAADAATAQVKIVALQQSLADARANSGLTAAEEQQLVDFAKEKFQALAQTADPAQPNPDPINPDPGQP